MLINLIKEIDALDKTAKEDILRHIASELPAYLLEYYAKERIKHVYENDEYTLRELIDFGFNNIKIVNSDAYKDYADDRTFQCPVDLKTDYEGYDLNSFPKSLLDKDVVVLDKTLDDDNYDIVVVRLKDMD